MAKVNILLKEAEKEYQDARKKTKSAVADLESFMDSLDKRSVAGENIRSELRKVPMMEQKIDKIRTNERKLRKKWMDLAELLVG